MKLKIILFLSVQLFVCSLCAQTKLWGTTHSGSTSGWGTIYSLDSVGGNFQTEYYFTPGISKAPLGNLCLAGNGNFYGITGLNQFNHDCYSYKYNPVTGVYQNIHDFFADAIYGRNGRGGLIRATNDILYGVCANGGANDFGVIYSINPTTDAYSDLSEFDGTNGANPIGTLLQASNGKLYGIGDGGGIYNSGVLFSFDISTSTITKIYDFPATIGGDLFYGSLLQANDGKLYGVTQYGGAYNYGELFCFDITTNVFTDLFDFDFTNGANPQSNVIETTDGNLYGMTYSGGQDSLGVLFRFNPVSNTFTKLLDFTGNNGAHPTRRLLQTANGKLIGTTFNGGIFNDGVVFNFDIISNAFNKLIDFNLSTIGSNPDSEISETPVFGTAGIFVFSSNENITISPNPTASSITLTFNEEQNHSTLKIIDVIGKEVFHSAIYKKQTTIDISALAKGIYFVEVTNQGLQVMRSKVLKE